MMSNRSILLNSLLFLCFPFVCGSSAPTVEPNTTARNYKPNKQALKRKIKLYESLYNSSPILQDVDNELTDLVINIKKNRETLLAELNASVESYCNSNKTLNLKNETLSKEKQQKKQVTEELLNLILDETLIECLNKPTKTNNPNESLLEKESTIATANDTIANLDTEITKTNIALFSLEKNIINTLRALYCRAETQESIQDNKKCGKKLLVQMHPDKGLTNTNALTQEITELLNNDTCSTSLITLLEEKEKYIMSSQERIMQNNYYKIRANDLMQGAAINAGYVIGEKITSRFIPSDKDKEKNLSIQFVNKSRTNELKIEEALLHYSKKPY